nr:fibronectin type III domain-containing protein [Lysinibacter cavernae]
MDDPEVWTTLPNREVTLASLTNVQVTPDGFTITPDFLGVEADTAGRNPQATRSADNESWWGSFPNDFNEYQNLTGQSSYWYTTDGGANSIQPRKATLPLTVSYTQDAAATAPAAPAKPTAVAKSNGGITTTWVAPADGGSAITGYTVTATPAVGAAKVATVAAGTLSYDFPVLLADQSYTVTVTATNAIGSSAASAASASVVPNPSPSPAVTVTPNTNLNPAVDQTVTLSGTGFTGPAAANGTYVVLTASDNWQPGTVPMAPNDKWIGTQTWVNSSEIKNGAFSKTLTIAANSINADKTYGYGTFAAHGLAYTDRRLDTFTPLQVAVPAQAPAAPAAPTASAAGPTGVKVDWTAPAENGGSAITGYTVTLTAADQSVLTKLVAAGTNTATFDDLSLGQTYTATVVATNAAGNSPASAASNSVTVPATAPAAPAKPTVTAAGPTSLNVAWAAPANNGAAITGYTVTVAQGGSTVTSVPVEAANTTVTVDGLSVATEYSVTVTATNAAGTSAASAAASASTLATAPATLAAPTVTAASGTSLNVAWVAPANNGGSAITGYTVTVSNGSTVAASVNTAASATSTIVGGLTRGTSYTVTITATNAAGTSEVSAATPAQTLNVPAAVTATAALTGTNGVTVTWATPATDGGSAITGYTVRLSTGGNVVDTATVAAGTLSATFSSLTPGASYTATVESANAVGSSTPSSATNAVVVPAVAPAAPAAPIATGTDQNAVSVGWKAPSTTGGSPVTGYVIELTDSDNNVTTKTVNASTVLVTFEKLAAGTYSATVSATNAVGSSPVSAASNEVYLPGVAPTSAPALLAEDDFTKQSEGIEITVSADRSSASVDAGVENANSWVGVSVHSEATFVGWALTDGNGIATVALPKLPAGTHHVAVYGADGSVLGYTTFVVAVADNGGTAPGTGGTGNAGVGTGTTTTSGAGLAVTGAETSLATLAALLLLVAGAGALVRARTRREAADGTAL